MKEGLNINSEMLSWSIQRAGLNLDDFVSKHPDYQKWIDGWEGTLKFLIQKIEDIGIIIIFSGIS